MSLGRPEIPPSPGTISHVRDSEWASLESEQHFGYRSASEAAAQDISGATRGVGRIQLRGGETVVDWGRQDPIYCRAELRRD